ncbi:MAG: acetylxylan esterase [Planctomycetales bacterium]
MSLTTCTVLIAAFAFADDLTVLEPQPNQPEPAQIVYERLRVEAHAALDRRREEFEKLETPDDCRAWQTARREFFVEQLGGWPERTPLEPAIVGTLRGDGYRIEKVIYASRPGHHVTASLWIPEGDGPFPAVLVSSGHSRAAKAAGYNQQMCLLLVKNGFAAFAYDPIGQGERSQILDDDGNPRHANTTVEHSLIGVGSILVGTNTAAFRIWDAIRGIDYLASRDDIDAERIGMTGCSGGGTLTSYVMALDDRVACAAPACYVTTFGKLLDTIGPQDAEQDIHAQLAFGMDQPDYLLMRAPKPTLICATTGDFFAIDGTWDAFRQAQRFYTRMGYPERVDLVEAPGGHGIPKVGREAMVHWMRRWLKGSDAPVRDEGGMQWAEADLRCTPHGQVLRLPGERSSFDINVERERRLAEARTARWKAASPEELRRAIRKTAGVRPLDELPQPKVRKAGVVEREGYRIEKLVLDADDGVPLPALLFVPPQPKRDAWLYLHGEGKHVDAAPGGEIESLVQKGHLVLAVDIRGIGETSAPVSRSIVENEKEFYLAYLLGKPLVGLRTEDILISGRFLAKYEVSNEPRSVHVAGIGSAAIPALHAAALEPALVAGGRLSKMPCKSWAEAVKDPNPVGRLTHAIHAALAVYDLPNLVQLGGEDRLIREEPATMRDR